MVPGLSLAAVAPATLALLDPVGLFAEVGSDRGMPRQKLVVPSSQGFSLAPQLLSNPFPSAP